MKRPIYLDHSATTPLHPRVLEAMLPYLETHFGNPGSVHAFGRAARKVVEDARDQVAALINADSRDIYFTSGGTEADNLAVSGIVAATEKTSPNIVTTAIEHHAVLHAVEQVAKRGLAEARVAPCNAEGRVSVDGVLERVDEQTVLVSVMHANNETGVVQPMEDIAVQCAERGVPFHCDAVQSAGKLSIDVRRLPASLLAMSAHKLNGPKGVGAVYLRKGIGIEPHIVGGAQERGRRAGTENVAAIVGFGMACELARQEREARANDQGVLRDRLEQGILQAVSGVTINGATKHRLPNITNLRFDGVEGESILLGLDVEGIAVSTGSACTAGSLDPSHVLLAMGLSHEAAQASVRFSLGLHNTASEIDEAVRVLAGLVSRLREAAPLPTGGSLRAPQFRRLT